MFCDQCHWYTAGEKICPHCGAEQGPEEAGVISGLTQDESISDTAIAAPPAPREPVPEAPPLPPEPAPVPLPKPAPSVQKPVPLPAPKPTPAPKPAPPLSGSNKQGMKFLVFVLVGVGALLLVLFFSELAKDVTYNDYPDYDDAYYDDSYFEFTALSMEDAQAGDTILFGDTRWVVLEEDPPGAFLLLMENGLSLPPGEVQDYIETVEVYDDDAYTVYMGGVNFTEEEFARILPTQEGNGMFLLTPEEMAEYGVEPPEVLDDGLTPVRPAMRVNR